MNKLRFSAMQEAYDNMEAPFDEGLQTQEEIDLEIAQKTKYDLLIREAAEGDFEGNGYEEFCKAIKVIHEGEFNEAGDLLFDMIVKAANYNGSEATVPDFVRLVRMAFEWKSKQ